MSKRCIFLPQNNFLLTNIQAHIKDNKEKIKLNKQLPYLVANVIEIVEPYVDPNEDFDGGATDISLVPEGKGAVV